jgi:FtsH-binding integral membrane protein
VQALLKFNDIDQHVQRHLVRVYATLAVGVGLIAAASYALTTPYLYFLASPLLGLAITLGSMFALGMGESAFRHNTRVGLYALFCVGEALSISPLIGPLLSAAVSSLDFDSAILDNAGNILTTAFLGACAVFTCFTLSALFSRRRSFLFLSSILSSALSWLLLLSLFSSWLPSGFSVMHLYAGLFVFLGYILVDTQMIIEKAAQGSRDYLWHAVELTLDFVAVFVRLVVILARNAEKKKDDRKRGSR